MATCLFLIVQNHGIILADRAMNSGFMRKNQALTFWSAKRVIPV